MYYILNSLTVLWTAFSS